MMLLSIREGPPPVGWSSVSTGVVGLTSDQQVRIRICAPSVGTPDQLSRGAARPVPEGVMGRSVTSRSTRTVTPLRDGRATPQPAKGKEGMDMTIVEAARAVTGGIDTHGEVHVAAALDEVGGLLGTKSFDAPPDGYSALLSWLAGFGEVGKVGVEGTGSYGAGLARFLARAGVEVIEVDRHNRQARRRQGKSRHNAARAGARGL